MENGFRTGLVSGLVALVVSAGVAGASPSPVGSALFVTAVRGGHAAPAHPSHGIGTAVLSSELPVATSSSSPSLADIVKAQGRRIDALSKKLAVTTRQANTARNRAENANDLIDCIAQARRVVENANGQILSAEYAAPGDQASFYVPVYADSCLEGK